MKVSTSWSTFTVGQYQELLKLSRAENIDQITRSASMLSIMSGKDIEEIMDMPITEVRQHLTKCSFINTPAPDKFINYVKIGDQECTVNPDITSVTSAMYLDYESMVKDDVNDNLHEILAMWIRPDGEKYDSAKAAKRAKIIQKEMTMDVAFPLANFFLACWKKFLEDTLTVTMKKLEKNRQDLQREISEAVGSGLSG